jgi:hemerythrin-like domain-containing protein
MPGFDLYTTIHKGLRHMLCDLGSDIRMNDFADEASTAEVIAKAGHYLQMFYEHALREEESIHSQLRSFEPDIVERLEREHQQIEERGALVRESILKLEDTSGSERRIAVGIHLNQVFNAYQAFFYEHIDFEEVTVLPLTQQYFDDMQLAAMRGDMLAHNTMERNMEWLDWMFRSGDVNELSALLASIKASPLPSETVQGLLTVARKSLGEERWRAVQKKAA